MKKQKPTQDIQIIQKSLSPIAEKALHLEIDSDKSLKEAVSILSKLNQFNDRITEEKEKVTKPLNEALKAERARWKPAETLYNDAIDAIRAKMVTYQTNLVKARLDAEYAIAQRIKAGKGNLSIEKAVERIESLETIEKEHATEEGLVQFREKKQLKITDLSLLPDIYWMVNEPLLLTHLKEGIPVDGAELETIQVPYNLR